MKKLNKLKFTLLTLLLSVYFFAQERASRPDRFESQQDNTVTESGDEYGDPEVLTLTPEGVPIDDYAFILVGIALLLITFIYFRNKQIRKI